jgi:hypothetical protein
VLQINTKIKGTAASEAEADGDDVFKATERIYFTLSRIAGSAFCM